MWLLRLLWALPPLPSVGFRPFDLSRIHFPASLRSTVVTRFAATTDALTTAGRFFGPLGHERRLSPTGLPDYRGRTAGHSDSNHQRADRGSPGCQRIYARPDRLRLSLAGSPSYADRIEFTADGPEAVLCFGLVVLVPLLSTPPYGDAVTVRYRTVLHRTGADFHRSIPSPSQAHERASVPARSGENRQGRLECSHAP